MQSLGGSLWISSSGSCCRLPVGLVVLEHGAEDVTAASGQANQGCIVFLAFGAFSVVVGAVGRVVQCGEGREEQRAFEFADT